MSTFSLAASHRRARVAPSRSKVIHARYHERDDLADLAKCDNINGPICDDAHLTSEAKRVTCKRCLRIMNGTAIARKAWSPAALRLNSRLLAEPPKGTSK